MEISLPLFHAFTLSLIVLIMPVYSQISTPCTSSMLSTVTPCMNFLTNSSSNGTSPTADCCSSLRSLTSNGTDCLCLIVTGNVPFQIPINRTLALSLPRACNMPGVPLRCKASGAPVPASGPVSPGPTMSPKASPSASPQASTVPAPSSPVLAPPADTSPATAPTSPTGNSQAPPSNSDIRPVVNPSAAVPSLSLSPSFLLAVFGAIALKYY